MLRRLLLLSLVGLCNGQSRLASYNLDSYVSVSGLSSGAYMANQVHVSLSGRVMGAALFAGGPYYCAEGNVLLCYTTCMKTPAGINIAALQTYAQTASNTGLIDPLSNLGPARVFIFSGTKDSIILQGVARKLQDFYSSYITSGSIKAVYNVAAEHGMPTDSYGGACGALNSDYINNCNYNGAYEALNQIYGGLQKPSPGAAQTGQLILFDQSEFFTLAPPVTYGMDSAGYLYIPPACMNGARCRLHISFHGCLQGREKIGDRYARYAGYNQVADLNNFIVLYPQARSILTNPNGCWDWWGYTGIAYATKPGFQITAVERMLLRAMGQY